MTWWSIVKESESHSRFWEPVKRKFNSGRNLGYVMSYWYLNNQQEIDEWVASRPELEGVFIDLGDRSKRYRYGVGGYFIFNRVKLDVAIKDNIELLEKYSIPATVDDFIGKVANTRYGVTVGEQDDIYNFIADQFGDARRRVDNPLREHRRE